MHSAALYHFYWRWRTQKRSIEHTELTFNEVRGFCNAAFEGCPPWNLPGASTAVPATRQIARDADWCRGSRGSRGSHDLVAQGGAPMVCWLIYDKPQRPSCDLAEQTGIQQLMWIQ